MSYRVTLLKYQLCYFQVSTHIEISPCQCLATEHYAMYYKGTQVYTHARTHTHASAHEPTQPQTRTLT